MKTLRTQALFRLVMLATIFVLFGAIFLLGTEQWAEGWSPAPFGGAHGVMASHVIEWLLTNNWHSTNNKPIDWQLVTYGASVPDSIWKPGGES